MTSKTFPKKKQRIGLPLIKITIIACVTSLISIVAGIDIGQVTEVSPNSTEHISAKSLQNVSKNKTLNALKPHDRSHIQIMGVKGLNSEVEYLGLENASEVPREVAGGTRDLLEDMITQAFKPGERTSGLEWLHSVYNPHLWGSLPPGGLGTKCDADMKTYLAALHNGTVWAAKSTYIHSFDRFYRFTVIKILGATKMRKIFISIYRVMPLKCYKLVRRKQYRAEFNNI
jgi:hypothetical protein